MHKMTLRIDSETKERLIRELSSCDKVVNEVQDEIDKLEKAMVDHREKCSNPKCEAEEYLEALKDHVTVATLLRNIRNSLSRSA